MDLKPLLLAGGKSSRMGTPKHLLQFPDDETYTPMYIRLIRELHSACDRTEDVYISLKGEGGKSSSTSPPLESEISARCNRDEGKTIRIHPIYDSDVSQSSSSNSTSKVHEHDRIGGPAAGLLAAYQSDPTAHWLVLPCDFPFVMSATLEMLRREYEEPVTCFKNAEGFCEPLLGIWGPKALEMLEENVRKGRTGPKSTVRDVGGKMVTTDEHRWLVSVNTTDEWEDAKRLKETLVN